MGHSNAIKRVQTVAKQPLVLDQRVVNPKARQEKKKKRKKKKKRPFEDHVEDKIVISTESRQSLSPEAPDDQPAKQSRPGGRVKTSVEAAKRTSSKPQPTKPKRLDIMV